MPPKASGGAGAAPRRGASQQQQQQPGSNGPGGSGGDSILKKPNAVAVNKDNAQQQQQQQGDSRNKVVVRRCPPELPEAVFWQSVEPWIKDDAADWKMYKQGRARKHGSNKESVNSVAYIHFKKQEHVAIFAAAYQGHTFRDSKGNRYAVVVQFAPFQKTPPKKVKPDPLAGTIDDDAEYQAFVKSLTEPEEPKAAEPTDSTTGTKGIKKTTPLLEELRRKKQENARKKAEDVKQSRSAKRAAARAAASASAGTASTTQSAGTGVASSKLTAAEAKAHKKAERREKRKGKGQEEKLTSSAGVQSGPTKPVAKGAKVTGGKQKAAAVPKQPEAPPKMTILAPPKPAVEKKEELPKSTAPSVTSPKPPAVAAAAVSPPTAAKSAVAQPAKPKPSLSSFDDIVGQFAKQMQSAPVKKAAPKTAADKHKRVSNGEKIDTKRTSSVGKAPPKVTSPTPAASGASTGVASPTTAQSQTQTSSASTEAGRGRGRGRGAAHARGGGGRKESAAGRGGPLSPTPAPATPAPS